VNIIILDDYQDAVRKLKCASILEHLNAKVFTNTVKGIGQLSVRLRDAEVLVLIRERTQFPRMLLEKLPKLRLISQTGRVGSHIDVEACTRLGIAVAEGVGSPVAPAELTWALVLAALRHIPHEAARLRAGHWQSTMGTGLRGRTLGIWGYGKIGTLVARYGRAFEMDVRVWGREGSLSRARSDGFALFAGREELFERSDVLSLHLKLSAETRGIVTAADLARMRTDALLVNTSRAELIAPGALEAALRAGRPGFAAVDVYEEEPVLGAAHPLLALDNAVCTPHLGYVERDSYESYFGQAFDQVAAFAEGRPVNAIS
jgi:D-3-phosphoglycerate dehydrogenase